MICERIRTAAVAAVVSFTGTVNAEAPAEVPSTAGGEERPVSTVERFREAQSLYDSGQDFARALGMFRAVLTESGSPNARLYVARSLEHLSQYDEAYTEMSVTLYEARLRAEAEPKYAATRDAAAAELALLEQKVAKLVLVVADAPEGTIVSLNGKPITTERLGVPFAVLPGNVVVVARAPGRPEVRRELVLHPAETQSVALVLAETKPEPAGASPPRAQRATPLRADSDPGSGLRTAGYVSAGAGVVGLGVFTISGLMANAKFSSLEKECSEGPCDDRKRVEEAQSGQTLDRVANVGLAVGLVGLAAGGTLVFLGSRDERSPQASLAVSPTGGRLSMRKKF